MNRKVLIFSLLAMVGLTVFALSALTVYALVLPDSVQAEAVIVDEALEAAPVQALVEPVEAPAVEIERANYFEGGGCSHSKMMMTQSTPAEETVKDQPLAQVGQ